jgi:Holliday junction resolvase
MSNPAKAKGSKAERDVVNYLIENGYPYAERRLQGRKKIRAILLALMASA